MESVSDGDGVVGDDGECWAVEALWVWELYIECRLVWSVLDEWRVMVRRYRFRR